MILAEGFFFLVIPTKFAAGFIKGGSSSSSSSVAFDVQTKLICIVLVIYIDIECKPKPKITASLFYFQRDSQLAQKLLLCFDWLQIQPLIDSQNI